MITLLLISLAATFKAVADTLDHHFFSSVFRKWENSPFWNPLHKRNDAVKKIFGYPVDAWHIANTIMIGCFITAAFIDDSSINWFHQLLWWVKVIVAGTLFIVVFNSFYNKILR